MARIAVTAWDGRLRLDHVQDRRTVALTLLSAEPVQVLELRHGLVAGFVSIDPEGPPTYVAVRLEDGAVPADVVDLLGPRVSGAVSEILERGEAGGWISLDLVELDRLARSWAPYRARVLVSSTVAPPDTAPAPQHVGVLGVWADDFWTCLGLPRLANAVGAATESGFRADRPPSPVRIGEDDRPDAGGTTATGVWELPAELARAVSVSTSVRWTLLRRGHEVVVTVAARPEGADGAAALEVGVDGEEGTWMRLGPDAEGVLTASVAVPDGPSAVRFRSRTSS